jgi:hypothetical protein
MPTRLKVFQPPPSPPSLFLSLNNHRIYRLGSPGWRLYKERAELAPSAAGTTSRSKAGTASRRQALQRSSALSTPAVRPWDSTTGFSCPSRSHSENRGHLGTKGEADLSRRPEFLGCSSPAPCGRREKQPQQYLQVVPRRRTCCWWSLRIQLWGNWTYRGVHMAMMAPYARHREGRPLRPQSLTVAHWACPTTEETDQNAPERQVLC